MKRPASVEHPRETPSSGLTGYLIAFYLLLIAYVSLTPFSGWRLPATAPWTFLWQGWPKYFTHFDLAINFIAYLPFGLLLYAYRAPFSSRGRAIAVSITSGVLLSLVLEILQGFLYDRIASNLDFLLNSVGCASGALLSAWLGRHTKLDVRLSRWRQQLFLPGVTIDIGLALLCLWLISQLNPSIPFFGAGVVTEIPPSYGEGHDAAPVSEIPFALGTALNFCGLGLFVLTLMRSRSHALVAVQVLTGVALCLKLFAAYLLLRPQVAAHWHSDETLTGLAIGFVVLLPLSFVRLNLRIYLAAVLILAGGMLSKMAGSYTSLREVLRLFDWPYGQLLHFTGLTLYLHEIWPLVALIFLFWCWWRQRLDRNPAL
ncbi:MAG: VanZ family protein [Pseudomonadota bacterium]|nr:VanZ family protein [Pseudomonadota bacterium]